MFEGELRFEESDVAERIGSVTTHYTARFAFGSGGWSYVGASVNVRYYPPGNWNQFESAPAFRLDTANRLIIAKRRAALARLGEHMPLGKLLRSCCRF